MRSSNEMFERGVIDAEQDDLNIFYYQHYYHYRKGYDRARKHVQRTANAPQSPIRYLLALTVGIVLVVAMVGVFTRQVPGFKVASPVAFSLISEPTATPTPRPTRTPRPTPTPRPTNTPTPSPQPALRVDSQARVVNVGDAALLGRRGPSVTEPEQARFPEGTQVTILAGPVEADGYIWWHIQDDTISGWSAESSQEGVAWLEPVP